MSYETLVIKDTQNVNQFWKWITVITLILALISSLTVSFSFHELQTNFHSNCIAGSKVAFTDNVVYKSLQNESTANENLRLLVIDEDKENRIKHYEEAFRTFYEHQQLVKEKKENITEKANIFNFRKNKNMEKVMTEETVIVAEEEQQKQSILNAEDFEFFHKKFIDLQSSSWGSLTSCDYFNFVPLLEGIIALVWLTLLLIYGNGGKSERFVDEPWRIVLPAIITFFVMAVISYIYLVILLSNLADFCMEFKSNFNNKDIPCGLLINRFSLDDNGPILPSINYLLSVVFAWMTAFLWTLAVIVMILRCIIGSDFQMIDIEKDKLVLDAHNQTLLNDANK